MPYRHRDAGNGQFVPKRDADRRPNETVRERVKPSPPCKPSKK